jgi:hypothetical protein
METPRYITLDDVKSRLIGKVEFDDGTLNQPDDMYVLSDDLLSQYVCQAESEVEFELSPIYVIPFVTDSNPPLPYIDLDATAYNLLRTLFLNRACIMVMETEFAKDTGVKGEHFIDNMNAQYKRIMGNLTKRSPEGRFLYPQIGNLAVNGSRFVVTGTLGAPVASGGGDTSALEYANRQGNNPATNVWFPAPQVI